MDRYFFNNSKGTVDEDGVFFYPNNEDMTPDELQKFVNYHRARMLPRYQRLRAYYKGNHDILKQKKKANWKPDNRLLYNFPKKLVTTFGGFFLGTPAKIDIDTVSENDKENVADKELDDWLKFVNFDDVDYEVSKQVDIFGRSHFFLYQDENSKTQLTTADPRSTFVIYSKDEGRLPLFAVRYQLDWQKNISGTLYTAKGYYNFKIAVGTGCVIDQEPAADVKQFGELLPIIEVYSSEERMGLYEDLMSVIDGINHEMSEKANDFDAQADSILKIIGAKMPDDKRAVVRENRTLEIPNVAPGTAPDVDYINKADNDGMQEHLIDRNIDLLYQISGIANLNDEVFGTASGTALEYKLQPMANLADTKASKMTTAIKKMLKTAFTAIDTTGNANVLDKLDDVSIKFTKTSPKNVNDEADTLNKLLQSSKISPSTALKVVSIVDDPDKELEKVRQSDEEDLQTAQQLSSKFHLDADKPADEDKANEQPTSAK